MNYTINYKKLTEEFIEANETATNFKNRKEYNINIQSLDNNVYNTVKRETIEKEKKKLYMKNVCNHCKILKQQIKDLIKTNEEITKLKDNLSKINQEILLKNNELINTNKELVCSIIELKKQKNLLEEKITQINDINYEYKNEINELKRQLVQKINEIGYLSSEIKKLGNNTLSSNLNSKDISLLTNDSLQKKEHIEYNNKAVLDDLSLRKYSIEEIKNKKASLDKWKLPIVEIEEERDEKKKKERDSRSLINSRCKTIDFISKYPHKKNISHINNNITIKNIKKNIPEKELFSRSLMLGRKNFQNSPFRREKDCNSLTVSTNNEKHQFNSKIINDLEDLDIIARGLVKNNIECLKTIKIGYKLLFRVSEHGDNIKEFHRRCDEISGTLVVIKTKDDWIFGGYTSLSWNPSSGAVKKDNDSFVFSLNLKKIYFFSGNKEYSIYCDGNKGPSFVGMFSIEEKILNCMSYINNWGVQCFSGESSVHEINGGKNEFEIEELEVFQVIKN